VANPFHPSFGVSPPLLVGRDQLLDEFVEALEDGPGSSGRATLYTGARGSGKTVMLNAVEDRAKAMGWVVVSETASPGFVGRLAGQHLPRLLDTFDPKAVRRRLSGLSAPLGAGGLSWSTIEAHVVEAGLRAQVELLSDILAENGTGLLITLDEIHQKQIGELRELATTVQHAFREERELAFVGAGLVSAIKRCDQRQGAHLPAPGRAPFSGLGRAPRCRAGAEGAHRGLRASCAGRSPIGDGERDARVPLSDPVGRRPDVAPAPQRGGSHHRGRGAGRS